MLFLFFFSFASAVSISGVVKDTTTGGFLSDVQVSITGGGTLTPVTTAANGQWTFATVTDDAAVQVAFTKSGFVPLTLSRNSGSTAVTSPSIFDGFMTPQVTNGTSALTVTLSWGPQPADLELHFTSSTGCTVTRSQTCNINGVNVVHKGDATGGFGPETIEVGSGLPCGQYLFSVTYESTGFWGDNAAVDAAVSLRAYRAGDLVNEYKIPAGQSPGTVWCWNAFKMTVSNSNVYQLEAVNTFQASEPTKANVPVNVPSDCSNSGSFVMPSLFVVAFALFGALLF